MGDEAENLDPKNRGLGRGLDAIFGEDEPEITAESSEPIMEENFDTNDLISDDLKRRLMPVEWLRPCEFQPRKHFDQDALEDLAKSIVMHGILQPIVVRPVEDEVNAYEIIAGERRWRAAQLVQMHEVPVSLQYLDDEAVLEVALIENLQREDLSPIEEAKSLKKLMDDHAHTQEKLSVTIGKSRPYIANALRLLNLPDDVQALVNEGKLSAGHARALVGSDEASAMAQQILQQNLSVRDVERMLRDGKPANPKPEKPKSPKDVNTLALEEEMSRILGMNVKITPASKAGQGAIKIDYKSLDQLDDVMHRLSKG